NQGARAASGDVLLFLNPDTRAEGDPFSEIRRAFAEHSEAVAVAPRLLDREDESQRGKQLAPPDRENQRTFQLRRLPSLASDARQLLLLDHLLPNNFSRRRERYAEADREEPSTGSAASTNVSFPPGSRTWISASASVRSVKSSTGRRPAFIIAAAHP